ncbi:MAG: acetylglutamate kinase [Planctomycetota bacterium]
MRILVKIGGAQLEQPAARAQLCQALAAAHRDGHQLVIVHGGGNQIRQLTKALGLVDRYHEGLRITDAATADVVLMTLAGSVNKALVRSLGEHGLDAVGLSGADGGLFSAVPLVRPGVDLGYVGAIDEVRADLVELLLHSGRVPVLATVAPRRRAAAETTSDEPFYNLNADHAAGPLCRALGCDAALFLSDIPGVLGREKELLPVLTPQRCAELVQDGVATGGMLPKLEAALLALRDNPRALVKIAPANREDAVRQALLADVGTRFVADQDMQQTQTESAHG